MQVGSLNYSLCIRGIIKGTLLVGEHKVYPLTNGLNFPQYVWAYWLIEPHGDKYVVLNALFQ